MSIIGVSLREMETNVKKKKREKVNEKYCGNFETRRKPRHKASYLPRKDTFIFVFFTYIYIYIYIYIQYTHICIYNICNIYIYVYLYIICVIYVYIFVSSFNLRL